jgi:hypothetical protein
LTKKPDEEDQHRPGLRVSQQAQRFIAQVYPPPAEWLVDLGPNQAAEFPIHKKHRPGQGCKTYYRSEHPGQQAAGNQSHRRFAKIPNLFPLAERTHGSDHDVFWLSIPLKYFEITVFWIPKAGKNTE